MKKTKELARLAGFIVGVSANADRQIETLAALIRQDEAEACAKHYIEIMREAVRAENEACAKVCEAIYNDPDGNNGDDAYYSRPYLHCAEAIRERMK